MVGLTSRGLLLGDYTTRLPNDVGNRPFPVSQADQKTSFPKLLVLNHTVDGRNPANQLICGLSHYLQGFSTIPGGWEWDFFHQHYHCITRKPWAFRKDHQVNGRLGPPLGGSSQLVTG